MARDPIATLPNVISLSRIAMAAVFPFLSTAHARLLMIAAAAATDFLDGYLARRQGSVTRLGALIDPAADRGFMLVAVAVLWYDATLSGTAALVLIARDVVVLGAWLLTRRSARLQRFGFVARPAGKALTVAQLLALACALVAPAWLPLCIAVVAVTTVVAIADYTVIIVRSGRSGGAGLLLMAAVGVAGTLEAQGFRIVPRIQPELTVGAVLGHRGAAVVGAGVNVPAGYYVRVSPSVAAGPRLDSGRPALTRAEVVARFHFDPFAQVRWAPYVGAGSAVSWRAGDRGRAAVLVVGGVELPAGGGWQPALELGLGGGARISVIARRERRSGR